MDNIRLNQIRVRQQQCSPLIPQLGLGATFSTLVQQDVSWLISTATAQHMEINKLAAERDQLTKDIVWLQQERARLLQMTTFEDQSYDLGATVLQLRQLTAKVRNFNGPSPDL
jgi:hypothetical protein